MNDYRRITLPDNTDDVAIIRMKDVNEDVIHADSNKVLHKAVDKPTVMNIITRPYKPFAKKKESMRI